MRRLLASLRADIFSPTRRVASRKLFSSELEASFRCASAHTKNLRRRGFARASTEPPGLAKNARQGRATDREVTMQPTGIVETAKATNPLKDLLNFGQSVWLDYIRRDLITSGELKRLIDEDGLRGMTSNPAIFEKAIAGSTDYADILTSLKNRPDLDAKARYELLAIRDIQDAADLLRTVYDESKRRDGYISLEVSPYLARDTQGTLEEARRLWKAVD